MTDYVETVDDVVALSDDVEASLCYSSSDIFGNMFTPDMLEAAIIEKIEAFLDTYLMEMERRLTLTPGTIQRPRYYGHSVTENLFAGERVPAIVVVSQGSNKTEQREEYEWDAWFDVSVAITVEAASKDQRDVRKLLGYYIAAVRTLLIQQLGYDGTVDGVMYRGERYLGTRAQRATQGQKSREQAMGMLEFSYRIPDVATGFLGPTEPAAAPEEHPGNLPLVKTAEMHMDQTIQI